VCDLPDKYEELRASLGDSGFNVFRDGFGVVRRSDFVIYSVEAASINGVVARFGPSMKPGSVACGQVLHVTRLLSSHRRSKLSRHICPATWIS
jgi:prephenate dehydrogenase (NADP+)